MNYSATSFFYAHGVPQANYIAAGVNVISWILQFIGHGFFEKRAPALLDSLIQGMPCLQYPVWYILHYANNPTHSIPAFLLAPLFVFLEVLFSLGYRPALQDRVKKAAAKLRADFEKAKDGKKATTSTSKRGKAN